MTPEECQSKPSTQPNAWNHHGSARRRSISSAVLVDDGHRDRAGETPHAAEEVGGGGAGVQREMGELATHAVREVYAAGGLRSGQTAAVEPLVEIVQRHRAGVIEVAVEPGCRHAAGVLESVQNWLKSSRVTARLRSASPYFV